jgi:general secretion pathway protein L
LRPWRLAAGLLIALVGLSVLGRGVEYLSLSRADAALAARVEERCRSGFSLPATANCSAEVQRRLAAAGAVPTGSGGGFLAALAAVAEASDAQSRVTALSFRNGVLDLRLTAPSVPALDDFARRMTESEQFAVEIRSANPTEAGVEGQLHVAGAQP